MSPYMGTGGTTVKYTAFPPTAAKGGQNVIFFGFKL